MSSHAWPEFERYLLSSMERLELPENLANAVLYALTGPGKRLRPRVCRLWCLACGGTDERCLPACAAVELVHAFSLVHDDLPAMDDDDMRRGRPTLHRHTSEAMAILAGDGMLTFAFAGLFGSAEDPRTSVLLARELAQGATGMIAGQVYDTLRGYDPALDHEQKLRLIHSNKTGALIRAAARMGAISARASDRSIEIADRFGSALGLMFQIVDDIIDATQTPEHAGKRTGKDQRSGKLTYPGVLGLDLAQRRVDELVSEAARHALSMGEAGVQLAELAREMGSRTR